MKPHASLFPRYRHLNERTAEGQQELSSRLGALQAACPAITEAAIEALSRKPFIEDAYTIRRVAYQQWRDEEAALREENIATATTLSYQSDEYQVYKASDEAQIRIVMREANKLGIELEDPLLQKYLRNFVMDECRKRESMMLRAN